MQDVISQNKVFEKRNTISNCIFLVIDVACNRVQDVISQNKALKKYESPADGASTGLKALSKRSRERLEAYQHLFYLLQTNPVYLAKLIFELPPSRTTKFLESAILTLYNYASNQREEYLLLKLFKTALEEEIRLVCSLHYIKCTMPHRVL